MHFSNVFREKSIFGENYQLLKDVFFLFTFVHYVWSNFVKLNAIFFLSIFWNVSTINIFWWAQKFNEIELISEESMCNHLQIPWSKFHQKSTYFTQTVPRNIRNISKFTKNIILHQMYFYNKKEYMQYFMMKIYNVLTKNTHFVYAQKKTRIHHPFQKYTTWINFIL